MVAPRIPCAAVRRTRLRLALPAALSLVLAAGLLLGGTPGVAAAASGPLGKVTVAGADGQKPTVKFSLPFTVSKTVSSELVKGTGAKVANKAKVTFDFVVIDGRTGKELGTSYGTSGQASATLDKAQLAPGIVKGLVGTTVGSRVLMAIAPKDGLAKGLAGQSKDVKKNDTILFLVDLRSIRTPLARATGTAVTPPAGLPTVTLDATTGKPTITVPPAGTAAPTDLVVQPLIQGTGPVVAAGQTITVAYTGVIYGTGKQFDSSWDKGQTIDFKIGAGQVIKGWDQGLVGQTVGSQILLVVPPDLGYGSTGQSSAGISGTDTLVFVVDILDAF
jgi:peptidylprolyl isomerase